MQSHGPSEKGYNYFLLTLLFLIPLIVFALGLLFFFMGPSSSPLPYEWEIGRFSGKAEVYSRKMREWITVTRRTHHQIALYPSDRVKTGPDSDLDLTVEGVLDLRLKASSEIEMLGARAASGKNELKLILRQGALLGVIGEKTEGTILEIQAPTLTARVRQAFFSVEARDDKSAISVLDGSAQVKPARWKETFEIKALEILTATSDKKVIPKPKRLNYQEWNAVNEARDLIMVSPEEIAKQLDIRKETGSLFKYVFDEGVFYRLNWGYANHEFYKEEGTGTVMLRMDYDVYPDGCFSGMYFKTRDLDLSKVKHLSFQAKADPKKPAPEQFRIEFKDKFSILRGYSVKSLTKDWNFYAFDFNTQKPAPVSELVFVFENSRVGPLAADGAVLIKDLNIE